jgi:hypothetical protein
VAHANEGRKQDTIFPQSSPLSSMSSMLVSRILLMMAPLDVQVVAVVVLYAPHPALVAITNLDQPGLSLDDTATNNNVNNINDWALSWRNSATLWPATFF